MILSTANWNPSIANQYLIFSWNCEDIRIVVGEVVTVTQKLLISPDKDFTSFSFEFVFNGKENPPSDINGDYLVDISDLILMVNVIPSFLGQPNWNPLANMNMDNKIDIGDLNVVVTNFGKIYSLDKRILQQGRKKC